MTERPILFSAPMVKAILAGTKTQTRRVVKLRQFGASDTPGYDWTFRDKAARWHDVNNSRLLSLCKYGVAGDRLWVKETFLWLTGNGKRPWFRADGEQPMSLCGQTALGTPRWVPSIHMPRYVSRITLEVTSVRVERLNDITEKDAKAEGVSRVKDMFLIGADGRETERGTYRTSFAWLWDEINGEYAWGSNPWVWVVGFRRVQP